MQKAIEEEVNCFFEKTKNKPIKVISHFDTDGITSAAIISKALKREEKNFSVKILKSLDKSQLEQIKEKIKNEVLVFLDLGSSLLNEISSFNNDIFIIDHHELPETVPSNIRIINPHLLDEENVSSSGLTYLFCKTLNPNNKDLANLAVIGMVGDMLDRNLSKLNNHIVEDSDILVKKGPMLYPATRPIHKALEFSSSIYIPGVTGNPKAVIEMLKDIGIERENGEYKSLVEMNDDEISKLVTSILLKTGKSGEDIIGNLYLLKFFNKLEDARELSAMINACSRLGCSETALAFCMDSKKARKDAETIYAEYKQHLVSALNFADSNKIEGKGYVILNAKDRIKDTIIGTVASILSMSKVYDEGTVVVAMSYDKERIKASARIVGRQGRNVREMLGTITQKIGGECGGHPQAAGCLISKEKEIEFLENLIKNLELEIVRI